MVYNLKSRRNKKSAFTLIELLVVILILGILLAIAIPLYLSSVKNAAEKTTRANMKTIAQAAQAFKVANVDTDGTYPDDLAGLIAAGDLTQDMLDKPTGVTYFVEPDDANNTCLIRATETNDVYTTTGDITYDLATGEWVPAL